MKGQKDKKPYRKKEPEQPFESSLTRACDRLEGKNPVNYDTAELHLAIGQGIELTQVVPLAIDILRGHPLAEGDYYPGDLLESVLLCTPASYWSDHPVQQRQIDDIVSNLHQDELAELFSSTHRAIALWSGKTLPLKQSKNQS